MGVSGTYRAPALVLGDGLAGKAEAAAALGDHPGDPKGPRTQALTPVIHPAQHARAVGSWAGRTEDAPLRQGLLG